MSKKELALQAVKVDVMNHSPRRTKDGPKSYGQTARGVPGVNSNSNFVYVNSAYVGSLNSVNSARTEPTSGVYREQYWACSKWPYGQRVLAVSVGLLLGAVIGLAVTVAMKGNTGDVISGIFRHSPD